MYQPNVDDYSQSAIASTRVIVQNLRAFWKLKGYFHQSAHEPSITESDWFLEEIVRYLDNNTFLPDQPFWAKMAPETKLIFAKHVKLLDSSPIDMTVNDSPESSEIFVVFSGFAELSSASEPVCKMGIGKVFGALNLFNHTPSRYHPPPGVELLHVYSQTGSLLRVPFSKYFADCVTLPPVITPVKKWSEEDEDEPPEGMELTEDDIETIRIRKRCRKILDKWLFTFLLKNRLSPKLSCDPGRQYIRKGGIGRSVELEPDAPGILFIVVEGSFRLQMESTSSHSTVIRLHKKKQPSMTVKPSQISVMQFEDGSCFSVRKDLFHVGQQKTVTRDGPADDVKAVGVETITPSPIPKSDSDLSSLVSDSSVRLHHKRKGLRRGMAATLRNATMIAKAKQDKIKAENERCRYHLRLHFERATTYFAIPHKAVALALKESSYTMRRAMNFFLSGCKTHLYQRMYNALPLVVKDVDLDAPVEDSFEDSRRAEAEFVMRLQLQSMARDSNLCGTFHEGGPFHDVDPESLGALADFNTSMLKQYSQYDDSYVLQSDTREHELDGDGNSIDEFAQVLDLEGILSGAV